MITDGIGVPVAVGGDGSGASGRVAMAARVCLVVVLVLGVLSVGVVSSTVAAQASVGQAEVRIVARTAPNGRVEFGFQQRQPDDSWGERQLPSRRLFPVSTALGRWLQSSPLTLSVASTDVEVRIVARTAPHDRVEFGFQQRQPDDSWGERQLPSRRLFPVSTALGRWLQSSPLTVTVPAPEETPGSTEDQLVHPDADAMREMARLAGAVHRCDFDTQTGECANIVDDWNAERIIQAIKDFFGSDCNPNLSYGGGCDNGWTTEQWRQRMASRICPEGWFFTDNDWLCHSIRPA